MPEQPHGGTTGRWLKRITQSMSGEPRDLAELVENLREASEWGLFDGDALVMLEGVLAVADMQGGPSLCRARKWCSSSAMSRRRNWSSWWSSPGIRAFP